MFSDKQELGSFAVTSLAYFVNLNKTSKMKKKKEIKREVRTLVLNAWVNLSYVFGMLQTLSCM